MTINNYYDKIIVLIDISVYLRYTIYYSNSPFWEDQVMFNIGEKIVYPMHGAGVIKSIEEREILGEKRNYYIMKMPIGDMQVMIPLDQMEEIGIRKVIDFKEIKNVLDVLASETTKMHKNWNRRYRANMELIKTGDIYEIAEVVRNLTLRDKEKGLSTGERKMLSNARQILISEIVLVAEISEEEAIDLIEEVILKQVEPTMPDAVL